jgi:hypothetical protein
MMLYALAESRAVMRFYEALESGKISKIYEAWVSYKEIVETSRTESFKTEEKIDEEYRKILCKGKNATIAR